MIRTNQLGKVAHLGEMEHGRGRGQMGERTRKVGGKRTTRTNEKKEDR